MKVAYNTGNEFINNSIEIKEELNKSNVNVNGKINILPLHYAITDTVLRYYSDPSDIIGKCIEGEVKDDECGKYKVICREKDIEGRDFFNKVDNLRKNYEYIQYYPEYCSICGKKINYDGIVHKNTGSKINTGIVCSSESRYCEDCREVLEREDEDFIDFYIKECGENKRIVSLKENKEEFDRYMIDCKSIMMLEDEVKRLGYVEISDMYDKYLSLSSLIEYKKNCNKVGIEKYNIFKKLR
jgi:hypothetical protein